MNHAKREEVIDKVPAVLAETDAVVALDHASPGRPQAGMNGKDDNRPAVMQEYYSRGTTVVKNRNVQTLADCWKASARGMVKDKKMAEDRQAGMWSKRSGDFAKHVKDKRGQKRSAEIIGLLEEAGFKAKGAKVLDIGCGPGTLSIPLARLGADVTSLDIAPGMLDQLREYAKDEGLAVNPLECSWWTADIDQLGFRKKYDLVLASMTPGVRDAETFDRMMACSKKFCYYSHFLGGGPHGMNPEIRKILDGDEKAPGRRAPNGRGHGPGIAYPFMYLYALGYHPLVRFSHNRWKMETNWKEAAERTIGFFEHDEAFDAAAKKKVMTYYQANAKDGKYRTQSEMYTGMMVWNVNQPAAKKGA